MKMSDDDEDDDADDDNYDDGYDDEDDDYDAYDDVFHEFHDSAAYVSKAHRPHTEYELQKTTNLCMRKRGMGYSRALGPSTVSLGVASPAWHARFPVDQVGKPGGQAWAQAQPGCYVWLQLGQFARRNRA